MAVQFAYSKGFLKDVIGLRKRYRLIEDDPDALKQEMRDHGYRGDLLRGFEAPVYKVRLANRSARRGKSGGFRAVYQFTDDDSILFIHIYSKTDKGQVSPGEIRRRIRNTQ